MRYSLFGQGEGVRSDCIVPLWASVRDNIVTDASVSARKQGVRPGVPVKAAQALIPELTLCPEVDAATHRMQAVWEALWAYTPWLETVGHDSFCLQIPGSTPPLREVRDLLLAVEAALTEQQRLRIGFAENPFLSRALVEWSRFGRVSGALYRKVGRQQLIVSPGLACSRTEDASSTMCNWIQNMPIRALWVLPVSVRDALIQLGVQRLGDLAAIPESLLQSHFGRESLLWIHFLHQEAGGLLRVNYPPLTRREVWRSAIDEDVSINVVTALLESLTSSISVELERLGAGVLKVGMTWRTDLEEGGFERIAKRPIYLQTSILAQLYPGISECHGRHIEQLEVYVEDIRPLTTIQMSFVIHRGVLVPASEIGRSDVQKLLHEVNRKFPRRLQVGLHPHFRELRWRAVSEQL